jgi:hypothetical protein
MLPWINRHFAGSAVAFAVAVALIVAGVMLLGEGR